MYYVRTYTWYSILLFLQFDHVFTSWYFIVLVILLSLNLTLCSILRFRSIANTDTIAIAKLAKADVKLQEKEVETVEETLKLHHFKAHAFENGTVYEKNSFGRYGTFITHLGILFTIVFFALAMYSPKVIDQSCYPGESIVMEDGATISVQDFHIEDENGNLDYRSTVNIQLANGKESGWKEIAVNHPASFGMYKVYQHTYGTIGKITVTDTQGNQDVLYMEDGTFLSKDGRTGIWFNTLYPDFKQEDGDFSLITSVTGHYENPIYTFNVVEDNPDHSSSNDVQMTPMLAFPEDEITVGDLTFHFEQPVEYPGLRMKRSYPVISWMLMASFLLMTIGFAITFLFQNVVVTVTKEGYKILGNHQEGIGFVLQNVLETKGEK